MRHERPSNYFRRFRALRGFNAPRLVADLQRQDRPKANVFTRLTVGIILVAAFLTAEAQTFPIGCRDMAAGRTAPACVTRIDLFHADANSSGLVVQKEQGLSIRPAVDFGAEVFSLFERCISDIAQILHNDAPCARFNRVADQLLTCHMEQVHRYNSFITAHAPQQAASGTSANGLDSSAGAPDTGAAVIQHPAVEEKCFTIGRVGCHEHTLDAHIHANNAALGLEFRNLNFVCETQIPNLANALDLGIFPAGFGYARVLQSDGLAKNGDAFSVAEQVTAISQWHRWPFIDAQIPFAESLQSFVTGRHLAEQGAGQLRRQPEFLAHGCVESAVQPIRVQFFGLEHLLGNPTRRRQIADDNRIHVRRVGQLYLDCANSFQYSSIIA